MKKIIFVSFLSILSSKVIFAQNSSSTGNKSMSIKDINYKGLKKIIADNPDLETLTLVYADTIPTCICELKKLVELNLTTTLPTYQTNIFPKCFGKMNSLRTLRLHGNDQSLDSSNAVWELKSIEHLYFDGIKNIYVAPSGTNLKSLGIHFSQAIKFSDNFFLSKKLEYLDIFCSERDFEDLLYPGEEILSAKFDELEYLKGVKIDGVLPQKYYPSFLGSKNLEYLSLYYDSGMRFATISAKSKLKFFELTFFGAALQKDDFPLDSTSFMGLEVFLINGGVTEDFFPSFFLNSQNLKELFIAPSVISIDYEIKLLSMKNLTCFNRVTYEHTGKLNKKETQRSKLYSQKQCDDTKKYSYQLTKEFESHF